LLHSNDEAVWIDWHSGCSIIRLKANQRHNREEVRTMEMAWGMIMTGFTLFGMMGLVIMSVTMTDEQKSASAHQYMDDSAAPTTEIRKAA
jgi:hypothetical protein